MPEHVLHDLGELGLSVPGSHQAIRGNGAEGWIGWATIRRREAPREAWFEAPDPAAEKSLCCLRRVLSALARNMHG